MIWLWDNAVTIANVVMAAAAIAALIYAHLQINEGKRAERRANAHQLWNETLHLAFDNPKLSDPTLKTRRSSTTRPAPSTAASRRSRNTSSMSTRSSMRAKRS